MCMIDFYMVDMGALKEKDLEAIWAYKEEIDAIKGNQEAIDKFEAKLLRSWNMVKTRIDLLSTQDRYSKQEMFDTKRRMTILNTALLYMVEECPECGLAQV